jgi:hypothetical protein
MVKLVGCRLTRYTVWSRRRAGGSRESPFEEASGREEIGGERRFVERGAPWREELPGEIFREEKISAERFPKRDDLQGGSSSRELSSRRTDLWGGSFGAFFLTGPLAARAAASQLISVYFGSKIGEEVVLDLWY